MAPNIINFKILSLNARGIRSFEKRKALFGWLMKDKSDICVLQESYSTPEVRKFGNLNVKGEMFFSHDTEQSKGVLILIKNSLEFELKDVRANCFCASLLRTQIHMPRHTSSARAKY